MYTISLQMTSNKTDSNDENSQEEAE